MLEEAIRDLAVAFNRNTDTLREIHGLEGAATAPQTQKPEMLDYENAIAYVNVHKATFDKWLRNNILEANEDLTFTKEGLDEALKLHNTEVKAKKDKEAVEAAKAKTKVTKDKHEMAKAQVNAIEQEQEQIETELAKKPQNEPMSPKEAKEFYDTFIKPVGARLVELTGNPDKLIEVLKTYGASKGPEVKSEHYQSFLEDLEAAVKELEQAGA